MPSCEIRAYQALIGVNLVRFEDGRPVAWRISGGTWNDSPRDARRIVETQSETTLPGCVEGSRS